MNSTSTQQHIKQSSYWLIAAALFIIILDLRLTLLDLKPFHHDEGVNAHFLMRLIHENYYKYDPKNYHGPFLYYVTLPLVSLFGLNDFSLRFSPVLFNLIQIALLFSLRDRLGRTGLLTALTLMGLSPAVTYYARTFIHESYFTSFTLATFVCFYYLLKTRKMRYLLLGAACLSILTTLKESFVLILASWGGAFVLTWIFKKRDERKTKNRSLDNQPPVRRMVIAAYIFLACLLSALIFFLFYSSFLTQPGGPGEAVRSIFLWSNRSLGDHVKPMEYYLRILLQLELPTLMLTIAGLLHAYRRRDSFSLFAAHWTLLTFLGYSAIPYKTPWLLINILLPAFLVAGRFVGEEISSWANTPIKQKVLAAYGVGLIVWLTGQNVWVNFIHYDDDKVPIVYAQTMRSYKRLSDVVEIFMQNETKERKMAIFSPEYWPLPWDLRDYPVGYYGHFIPDLKDHSLILVREDQIPEMNRQYGESHVEAKKPIRLRPGVTLSLWVRKDLWEFTTGNEA